MMRLGSWRRWATVYLVTCLACSSSRGGDSPGREADGSTDEGGANNTLACGQGSVSGTGHAVDPHTLGPVAGATFSAPGCTTAVTDDRGYINITTDPGFVIKLDGMASGYLSDHFEFQALTDNFAGEAYLWESSFASSLPGWSTSQGYVVVEVAAAVPDAGPCSTIEGVTLSVQGHPEIAAHYLSDPDTVDDTLQATTTLGAGVLGPIPPGSYVIAGAKSGCTVTTDVSSTFQFETTNTFSAGVLNLQVLEVSP